jgi:hypothetical protein
MFGSRIAMENLIEEIMKKLSKNRSIRQIVK